MRGKTVCVLAMGSWHKLAVRLLSFLLAGAGFLSIASACDQIPAGESFRIRLLQPLSSYNAKPGMAVQAILIESPECDGTPLLPIGTVVQGKVTSAHRVGLGLWHETAALTLEFDAFLPEDGPALPIQARVLDVDNARETVRNGVIHGVRITDAPQSYLTLRYMHLPAWDIDGLWVLTVRRAVFPVFPEPEIYFPAGTDMLLELEGPVDAPNAEALPSDPEPLDFLSADQLDALMRSFPTRTQTPKGRSADIVNVAFIGSRRQLEDAFRAAGWSQGDPIATRSVLHQMLAVLSLRAYTRLPMEHQWVSGRPNDLAWQKDLDSFDKRDHLRIWNEPVPWHGQSVWIASSTHDRSAQLSLRNGFIHRVDSDIDDERSKITRDLSLAGCVDFVHVTSRPGMPSAVKNATGDTLRTDDDIWALKLRNCVPPSLPEPVQASDQPIRPRSKVARYFRTQVLSFRGDILRSNAVYAAAQLGIAAVRHLRSDHQEALMH